MEEKREVKRPGKAGNKQGNKQDDKQARGGDRRGLRAVMVGGRPLEPEREERLRGLK